MNPKSFHLITLSGRITRLERGYKVDMLTVVADNGGPCASLYPPKDTVDGLELDQHVEIEVHVFDPAERVVVESNGEEGPANAPGD